MSAAADNVRFESVGYHVTRPTTLLVYRCVASTTANRGHFEGTLDSEVSSVGYSQLDDLLIPISAYQPVVAVYTSPLQRAQAVAERLSSGLAVSSIGLSQLRPRCMGSLQARYWDDLSQREKSLVHRCSMEDDLAPHGGETMRSMRTRLMTAIGGITLTHPGQRVALVTHREPINLIRECFGVQRFRDAPDIAPGELLIAQVDVPRRLRAA